MGDTIISGAYDMHIHIGPDIMPRKVDFIEMAERARDAGMAGYVAKSHYFETSAWAKAANARVPEVQTFGSISLNNSVGGMNPYAVDACARDGGKVVWFPTVDAVSAHHKTEETFVGDKKPYWLDVLLSLKADGYDLKPVQILDENDKLVPAVYDVIDVIAKYDMILCTGHISCKEGKAVVKAAAERGVNRIICTHVDSVLCYYEIEDQLEVLKYGAFIEHCYNSATSGKTAWDLMEKHVRAIGPDHLIMSTDRGQTKFDYPDVALREWAEWMLGLGYSETEVRKTMVDNPKQLLF